MKLKAKVIFLTIFLLGMLPQAISAQILGGNISWECQGNGEYIFQLKITRDCNESDITATVQNIAVWNHTTITSIPLNFSYKVDISPACTAAGGITPLLCGNGDNSGNGLGAIEEITYTSQAIVMNGTPPEEGWIFTFQSNERSNLISNLQNPNGSGMTLTAAIFNHPGFGTSCSDNSPRFNNSPHMIACANEDFSFAPNVNDKDLDSLVYSWGRLYDSFTSGAFNPPANPSHSTFAGGFAYNSPFPGGTLNSEHGQVNFTPTGAGNYAYKIQVDSYRNGHKTASVEQESVIFIDNCGNSNQAPTVIPPFNGNTSYELTVAAGDLVQFDIIANDAGLLQDGSDQTISITTLGNMYGDGYTNTNSGCGMPPCATASGSGKVSAPSTATMQFNWQTSCDHLFDSSGEAQLEVPYYFVFKVQDDYCPIPGVRYVTVKITVQNDEILPAPDFTCITSTDGDLVLSWNTITDNHGVFHAYEVNSVQIGSYGTVNNINTGSFTIPGGINTDEQFFISTLSGCNGNTKRHSDTISNLFLELNNPGNGEAILNWNIPSPNGTHFSIFKEYPLGTWTQIATVNTPITQYRDTITVCEEFINYRVEYNTLECLFVSNIEGDVFKDKIVPDIPVITNVDIDTLTGDITVNWNQNAQEDTYGYVIYQTDVNGNLVEIDTIWGIGNTSFTHYEDPAAGPYQYSIAAFDSCYTSNVPPTHQTSAKANPHKTIFLTSTLNVCERSIKLSWTAYEGFDEISSYHVFMRVNNSSWTNIGQTNNLSYTTQVNVGDMVVTAVQGMSIDGVTSFSNVDTLSFIGEQLPEMSHLGTASVIDDYIEIVHYTSLGDGVERVHLERYNPRTQNFEVIAEKWVDDNSRIVFKDKDVEVEKRSYLYRTEAFDTCGQSYGYSNIGQTMFLTVRTDEIAEKHILQWTPYEEFLGNLYRYEVYRAVDDVYDWMPIAVLSKDVRSYTDDVSIYGDSDDGKVCYYIKTVEGSNEFGVNEISYSNEVCPVISPTIYVPNAFTVGGENPVFKPETRQRQINDYLFEIYDRYGRVIFSTTDPDVGWDGYLEGQAKVAREGVYVYRLALRDGNGIEILKHGHVTLLNHTGISQE